MRTEQDLINEGVAEMEKRIERRKTINAIMEQRHGKFWRGDL